MVKGGKLMGIVLYSTGCPKCKVLEAKMKSKGISYVEINDVEVMEAKGIMALPVLEVDGELKNFNEAMAWLNEVPAQYFASGCESCNL